MHGRITGPGIVFDTAQLKGDDVSHLIRKIKDLQGIFVDERARKMMDAETIVYDVSSYFPVKEGTEGGLFFGVTTIYPGKVGDEYFMTKGHFHEQSDRSEYYWGIKGEGMLLLMDRDRNTWAEIMTPGSLHYIPSEIAHRVANTGTQPLSFGACWPSDAGHDYGSIVDHGFSARVIDFDGKPTLK